MGDVQGKVAFVTGGGSGIARVTAKVFAARGAKVVIAERDGKLAEEVANEIIQSGGEALAIPTDVLDADSVKAAVDQAREKFNRIDILFNCVGGSNPKDSAAAALDIDVWESTFRLNLRGTFLCTRAIVPIMTEQKAGAIVNVGTWGSLHGSWPKHAYVSAKGALISFTRAIAGAYTQDGVRANLVVPGSVKTPLWHARGEQDSPIIRQRTALTARYPFSVGEPEDIANIVLFLASDDSRMITGAVIPADGGRSAF